jgi:arylsulfatase A-like enzyme
MPENADLLRKLYTDVRPADRPNVLLLFTDQQRFDTIRALGADWMITPTLDRLCREGTAFTHACSPNPVCVAARHNLLTGQLSRLTGIHGNNKPAVPMTLPRLPQILADAGYTCEGVGKMHFVPHPRTANGFHRLQTQEELYRDVEDDDYALYLRRVGQGHVKHPHGIRNPLALQPQRSLLPEEHHPCVWVADRAVEAVRRNRNRPFFLWSSWIHPHFPLAVPDSVADLYKGAEFPDPVPPATDVPAAVAAARRGVDYEDPAKTRRFRELYYAAITHVDAQMGRVIQALEETGQLDNTLIIMTADHGEMLGDNGSWGKQQPYDGSRRIPCIVRWPARVAAGARDARCCDLLDILPTVLDACGLRYPGDLPLPGSSLLGPATRDAHVMEHGAGAARVVSIRTASHQYAWWYGEGREELYDLVADPHEVRDLVLAEPQLHRELRHALHSRLAAWERQWGHADLVGTDGRLRTLGGSPVPDWPPCRAGLDFQTPWHFWNLTPAEQARYQSDVVEYLAATCKEPTLDLRRVNWDFYLSCGGDPDLVRLVRGR